jgi:hypothetical protein
VEELFAYIFGIYIKIGYKNPSILTPSDYIKIGYKNPSILTPSDSVDVAT